MIDFNLAHKDDLQIIHLLANKIWWPTYQDYLSKEQITFMLNDMYTLPSLNEQRKKGDIFIIAYLDSIPVGFFSYQLTPKSDIKVPKIYLDEQIQGKGVGKAIIKYIEDLAIANGCKYIQINVNRNNPAYNFYQKVGFEISETVDIPYYQFTLNDYVMRKNITVR